MINRDNDGSTPLHKAAFAGKRSCMRYLIRKGANVAAMDDSGCTALHHAVNNGYQ
jgi:ankyrin repeat protein